MTVRIGSEGLKQTVAAVRRAFPDVHYTIEDMVIGRDKAALRVTMRGTHRGELLGVAPNGRTIQMQEIQIEHLRGGQIIAHWHQIDDLGLQGQSSACFLRSPRARGMLLGVSRFSWSCRSTSSLCDLHRARLHPDGVPSALRGWCDVAAQSGRCTAKFVGEQATAPATPSWCCRVPEDNRQRNGDR